MDLLPQSRDAVDEYVGLSGVDLEEELSAIARWAQRVVPDCVALSVTIVDDRLTFTLVDPERPVGVPVRAPAPVGDAGGAGAPSYPSGALDEDGWAQGAREAAADGIVSSLSLPLVDGDRVVANIDLYASSLDAFDDRVEELAGHLGSWGAGAVTNADLGFLTRARALEAPRIVREQQVLEAGVGVLAAREGLDLDSASRLLRSSAVAAGVEELQAARLVLALAHH